MCTMLLFSGVFYRGLFDLTYLRWCSSVTFSFFAPLAILSIIESDLLNPPPIVVELFISPCNYDQFFFMYFEVLLLSVHVLIIIISFLLIYLFIII